MKKYLRRRAVRAVWVAVFAAYPFVSIAQPSANVINTGSARALTATAADSTASAEPAATPSTLQLTLQDFISEIRQNNPSLLASRLEADALGLRGAQVSALPDPVVSVMYQPAPILTARGYQRSQWRVEQPIPYPGKLDLAGRIADLSSEVAVFEADAFEQDLILQAKQAYYELYRVQQQEALIEAFQEQLLDFEDAASMQYAVGTGMQQAVLKAQLEKNTLTRMELDLSERRRTAAEMLARIMNRDDALGFAAAVQIEAPPIPVVDDEALLQIAFAERPEVAAIEAADRRAEAQIDLAKKQFKPDFGFSLQYFDIGATDTSPMATGRDAVTVGVSVKVPLQRGRLKAQLEEARLRQAQVAARREALETSFRTQIADLVSQLREQRRQLALFEGTLVPQAETTLASAMSAYTTGRTDFLNLLDAERMLFNLSTGYEDTLARYLKTTAQLERALGLGSLGEISTLTAQR
jgi:outer membrane protein TolC